MVKKLIIVTLVTFLSGQVQSQSYNNLTVDLTEHHLNLTTAFTGRSITLFGSVEAPGEIIIVVKGTPRDYIVRRHDRFLGFWSVAESVTLHNMPSYYHLLSTQTLADSWMPKAIADRHTLGFDTIYSIGEYTLNTEQNLWRAAFIKQMQAEGKYVADSDGVQFLDKRLFRAELALSSDIPEGTYAIETFLLRDGEIQAKQSSPLIVRKVGVSDSLRTFQSNRPILFGLLTAIAACILGFIGVKRN